MCPLHLSLSLGISFRETGNKNSLLLSLQKLFKELKTSQYKQKTKMPPLHLTKPCFKKEICYEIKLFDFH